MEYKIKTYSTSLLLVLVFFLSTNTFAQSHAKPDTTIIFTPSHPLIQTQSYRPMTKAWGLDLLMSNNGFGLGMFYKYEMTDEISFMLTFAVSDVKDDAEFEQYDYFGNSFIPGKKNRLLMIPLMVNVQYRLFKDDIVDNFRPFISAGLGPTIVFVSPYTYDQIQYDYYGNPYKDKMDFFKSLGFGHPRYTLGGYIGAGAYFGMEKGSLTGLSVKYFLAPFPDGIEIMEGGGYIRNFGGLFITLTFGSLF